MNEKGKQNKGRKIKLLNKMVLNKMEGIWRKNQKSHTGKEKYQIQSLTVKVAKLTNHNRRLSRKLKKKDITPSFPILSSTVIETPQASTSNSEVESPKASPTNNETASPKTMASTLWDSLSPATQKRTTQKMILSRSKSPMRKGMQKHLGKRIEVVDSLPQDDAVSQKVVNFMRDNENSMTCPDKKKEKLRYRFDYLHVLHKTFLSEYQVECSYSHFCKLVPNDIVRPKL